MIGVAKQNAGMQLTVVRPKMYLHLCRAAFSHALQYTIHKVPATVTGLPDDERFVTTEERPDGIMENHWRWTSEIQNLTSAGE